MLKFQSSGLLSWVGVKEGDLVKKWQAIASLDKRELRKRLEKEMQDYLNQRWDFEQTQDTYSIGGRKLTQVPMTDTVKRILEKSQYDLNWSILDYEIAELAVEWATIYSPIEGIVTHVDTPIAGVNITPATATFTVANPNNMLFEAEIDEVDIGQIKLGKKATVTLDSFPEEEFEGEIVKINFEAITTKGGGTAFPIQIKLPENNFLRLKIGMNGDMEVVTEEKVGVLVVPNEAIFFKKDEPYLRILTDGNIKERRVEIGLETEKETEIVSGLSQKEQIVIFEKT